jgi:hypothetical protein
VLEKAFQALTKYIVQIRKRIQTSNNNAAVDNTDYASVTDVATVVDTSLLKAYIKTNDAELIQFLKLPNSCHIRECETVLQNYKVVFAYIKSYCQHRNTQS